jgi:hypothetical protein
MRYRLASAEQRSTNYVTNAALLRRSDKQEWYASGEIEGIQVNANTLPDVVSYLAPSMLSVRGHFHLLTITPDELRFRELVAQWHRERGVTSSPVHMAMCPAYQQIIAMGEGVIPLILRQLESEADDPDHWFWALRVLSGADPVSVDDRGDMRRMAAAWLDWGRRNLYAW